MLEKQKNSVVGITGGIGSGKTTVSNFFKTLGIPTYHADKEAKDLINRSKVIKRKLISLFGESAYNKNNTINKVFVRDKIFNNKELLTKMNAIVHPKVAGHFRRWLKKQEAPYILKEVAIIFENNLQSQYDYIITVVADEQERINRVIKRDNISIDSVKSIIRNQLSDKYKIKKSDFVITNNDLDIAKQQALEIHQQLLLKSKSVKF